MSIRNITPYLPILFIAVFPLHSEGKEKLSLYDMAVEQLDNENNTTKREESSSISTHDIISFTDENGMTALMKAAKEGNDWTIRLLIEAGSDVNARDKAGWTALMYAVRYQNSKTTVSILINSGAAIKVRNNHNTTPLLLAASYSQNPDILSLLLHDRSGAEEEVLNAFILAIEEEESNPIVKEAKLEIFFKKGIPVNGYYRGLTPLMYACKYNSTSLAVHCLLEWGADASIQGKDDKSALDYALENPAFPRDIVFSRLMKGKGS